ncbi:MAG: HAD hydrolase-like protein [Pseudomonadales bacterium]|jgi:phosphoglycolate phosphatase|nr:HAD hydrolase-like protein [Pseudomonadales bacterium]
MLLFDLDGTLSDPFEGIWRSINFALSCFGYPEASAETVKRYIGPPLDQTMADLTGATSEADVKRLVTKYRERYGDIGYTENTVYPGVPETLATLHAAGIAMAVCTSKRVDFALRILDLFGLNDYFRFVDGGDIGIEKWQQIAALRAHGQAGADTLMIGDRAVDLIAARKNGLRAGAVLWGYGSVAELMAEAPEYVFHSPNDWLQLDSASFDKQLLTTLSRPL